MCIQHNCTSFGIAHTKFSPCIHSSSGVGKPKNKATSGYELNLDCNADYDLNSVCIYSLVSTLCVPSRQERSQISWAYSPKLVKTNETAVNP